ncbi:sensor histidine kinase [Archangium gephyra]|uniref:sensor histidine kinase n=1 Tax=Archangium gephyra TaxID=48 RepID=UPI003B7D89C2
MAFSLSPSAPSLARATLFKMGVRVAVVIALATLFSYLHLLQLLRDEAVEQLERHVTERSQREQAVFVLAEDNHAVLKKALEQRIQAWNQLDPDPRFDSLFMRMPDGTFRNRLESFDGTRMVGVFVPPGVNLDAGLRRRILAAYDVVAQYGPAFATRFINTYITLAEGPVLLLWPGRPNWSHEVPADYASLEYEYYAISLPSRNPERRTAWSGIFQEHASRSWMVTVATPLDLDGQHVASFHHDVLLDELMERSIKHHPPHAYNLLVRDDGQLIAHPELVLEGATAPYNILGSPDATGKEVPARLSSETRQAHLRPLFERVKNRKPDEVILELAESGEYLAVARLRGPEWNFVTVLPKGVVSAAAFQAARYVLFFGLVSLLVELAIMYWVLRQEIARPLLEFTQAAHRVSAGDFQVGLDTSRQDELGQLAGAFRTMSDQVHQREDQLREANEKLEQRVEERTRELKDVHQQLVQTARQAGMAEIATNVLHNVGNVLNSVYTSAQVARERLGEMRLEQVGRVAGLLTERQGDLTAYLTEDTRGRNLMPFLNQLGQNLVDERKALLLLLDDVGRYTEHIGDIVKVQQTHARTPRLNEPVSLAGLVADALRINSAALIRHQVKEERHLALFPPVLTDKHKVLMILVNLISNAKYAMDHMPVEQRRLCVKLERADTERVRIEVTDSGVGIAPEMLTRIFRYGFTTRPDGHGFGLHSSALAAQELGGSLQVHSDGPGKGATFTLELPYQSAEEPGTATGSP